jgi:hypothetical protein
LLSSGRLRMTWNELERHVQSQASQPQLENVSKFMKKAPVALAL